MRFVLPHLLLLLWEQEGKILIPLSRSSRKAEGVDVSAQPNGEGQRGRFFNP
jgi:hypothetical protein